jgi:hemoglobin/transferrin/lactoferrin receptor protein
MFLCLAIFTLSSALAENNPEPESIPAIQQGAQEEAAEQEGKAEEEKEEIKRTGKVEKVIVTATRGEMEYYDVPATATIVSSEEIERSNPQNVTEILNEIPGVEVSGTGAAGSFRGIPTIRGWSSNRVLILVDGQRLNNTRESTDFAGIIPALVDVHQVERIEVVKGAGAVLYGSDALGGVINIITKKADERDKPIGGSLDLRYSTADEQSSGRVGIYGSAGFFSYRLGYSAYDADNYSVPDTFQLRPDFWQAGVSPTSTFDYIPGSRSKGSNIDYFGAFRLSENHQLELSGQHKETEDAEFPVSLGNLDFINYDPSVPVIPFSCNAGGCGQFLSFPVYDWDRVNLGYRGAELGIFDKIEGNIYYQETHKESLTGLDFLIAPPPFPGADPITFPLNFLTSSIIESTGINVKFDSFFTQQHQLTYGIDYYQDDLDETHFTNDVRDEQSVPDSTSDNIAGYVQYSGKLLPSQKLLLIAALRYDSNTYESESDPFYEGQLFDVTENDVTWNVGTIYQCSSNWNGYVNIGRSFRAPNLQERAVSGAVSFGGFFIQNPNLEAETNTNYEVGVKTQWDKFSMEAAVYFSEIRDLITAVNIDDPLTPFFTEVQLRNIDRVEAIGGELFLQYRPHEDWSIFTTYSRQRREDEKTGERLVGDAPQKATIGARWEPVGNRFWVEWISKFVDRQKSIDDPEFGQDTVPGYGVHSIQGGYNFNKYLTATLTVNNIFDKVYFESLAPNWWAPERNFVLGLRSTF